MGPVATHDAHGLAADRTGGALTATRPGRPRAARRVGALLGLALLAVGPAPAAGGPDLEDLLWDLQILPLAPDPPPAFSLTGLDGRRWSQADLRDRAGLLYFWESG